MRVSVIGAGAIGGWLTAGCLRAGAEVRILARTASLAALRKHGLILDDGETKTAFPVAASDDPETLAGADVLILGLKAHDLPGAAHLIEPALTPDTIVVPAINGLPWWYFDRFGGPASGLQMQSVDPGGVLSALIPTDQIVGSVVFASSYMAAPGHVRLVRASKVWLGDVGDRAQAARIADLFDAGGIPAEVTDRLHWQIWNKLWGNSNLNPLSALTRADVAQIMAQPHTADIVASMMREMAELGGLIGLAGFDDLEERFAHTRALGPIRTSMLQDVEAGRPIEIEPILGALVELAAHLDHPVPTMAGVYGMAKLMDGNLRA